MMGSKMMMGLMWCFIILTIFSVITEGVWLGQTESNAVNWLTKYTTKGFSFFQIPLILGSFFTHGIPALLSWDYSFFDNTWGSIVRLILFATLSLGVIWAFLILVLPGIVSVVANVLGGLVNIFRRV